MTKINSPVSILELSSTHLRLAIYDQIILNQRFFYEKKIDFTKNENSIENDTIHNLIMKAEKDNGHLIARCNLMINKNFFFLYSLRGLDTVLKPVKKDMKE